MYHKVKWEGEGRSVWTKFARSSRQRRLGVVVVVVVIVEGAFGEEGAKERGSESSEPPVQRKAVDLRVQKMWQPFNHSIALKYSDP